MSFFVILVFQYLFITGPTVEMNLVEAIRSGLDIAMDDDTTSGMYNMYFTDIVILITYM